MSNIYKKKFILLLATIMLLTFCKTNNAFALADYTIEQTYKVTEEDDGTLKFKSSLPNLKIAPYASGIITGSGDLSPENMGDNAYCTIYYPTYLLFLNANNSLAKNSLAASLISISSPLYAIADLKYKDFEICGVDWLVWGSNDTGGSTALSSIYKHYPELGVFKGSKKYEVDRCFSATETCIENCENNSDDCILNIDFMSKDGGRTYLTINDRTFREKIYNGEETVNTECFDPRPIAKSYDVNQERVKNGKTPYQFYYMRGYAAGNYACNRFLLGGEEDNDEYEEAYNCCVKASKSVCIKDKDKTINIAGSSIFDITSNNSKVKFCRYDKKICEINNYKIEIFASENGEPDQYCARTYSLCPYNFNIQKGTEKKKYFDEDECVSEDDNTSLSCEGQIKNFYQYNRHCTLIVDYKQNNFTYSMDSYAPFIDKACINFVGSSHNTTNYDSYTSYDLGFDKYKSFTAPIAECFSETLKNFLFNRAGHTECSEESEDVDGYGKCSIGYSYMEGDDLFLQEGRKSPTAKLIDNVHHLIMLAVILMLSLYGYNILIKGGKLELKDVMIMFFKMLIVIVFSASTWWYSQIFKFTYSASNTFSNLTLKIGFDDTVDSKGNYIKYDGCYFGDVNDVLTQDDNEISPNIENNNYSEYPSNRKYVAIFDSLDCKLRKYLGYSVGANIPGALKALALTLIFPFNIGIFLAVSSLVLFLFVLNFAVRSMYIFITSGIAIAILLYVSPIIIPCILFEKTKKMFDSWLKNLIGFALQPMVLFVYITFSLTIMDKYTLGEGIYVGSGIDKELVCGYSCVNSDTGIVTDYINESTDALYQSFENKCDGEIINIKKNSLICFFTNIVGTRWTLLQPLGINLYLLADPEISIIIMCLRVAFLFFILTKILSAIPSIVSYLTSSKGLPETDVADPFNNFRKLTEIGGVAKRGLFGLGRTAKDKLKSLGNNANNMKNNVKNKLTKAPRKFTNNKNNNSSGNNDSSKGNEPK